MSEFVRMVIEMLLHPILFDIKFTLLLTRYAKHRKTAFKTLTLRNLPLIHPIVDDRVNTTV